MKKIGIVLIALFFSPLSVQAETVFDRAESFQIAKAVKMGRKTSTSSPFHNNEISRGNGSGTPYTPPQISCSDGQYYSADQGKCVSICTGVTCRHSDVHRPEAQGNKCCCVDK